MKKIYILSFLLVAAIANVGAQVVSARVIQTNYSSVDPDDQDQHSQQLALLHIGLNSFLQRQYWQTE